MRSTLAIQLALSALLLPVASCAEDERAKQIDGILQSWNNGEGPGAVVSVIEHGQLVFEKGYGLAISNMEFRISRTLSSTWHPYRSNSRLWHWCCSKGRQAFDRGRCP